MENLKKLVRGKKIISVICNQWGDTGKGKFSDYFSCYWADVVARGTGGNNAGHTVILNGKEKVFHILPSGIGHDEKGVISLLGNGMVIDLKVLLEELAEMDAEGMTYKNLMISQDAQVIMPYHISQDLKKNQSQKKGGIGSTGRGIGPCYMDKIARRGIQIGDLYDEKILKEKLKKIQEYYPEEKFNVDVLVERLKPYADKIESYVKDTVAEMHRFREAKKKILLEGAQGLLLSIEHGSYPYVTSSDCSLNGTATGVGLNSKDIDLAIGIVKYPFMTRVGGGPLPTELGGNKSEKYCSEEGHEKEFELKKYEISYEIIEGEIKYDLQDKKIIELMNSKDEFKQGVGIRLAANEYGATTKRPRRTGWTDCVAAKYARNLNGVKMVLTKPDCLNGLEEFKLCFGYKVDGQKSVVKDFSKNKDFLYSVKPVYKTYKGYGDLRKVKEYKKLPTGFKKSIDDFEKFTGAEVIAVSTGPARDDLILR